MNPLIKADIIGHLRRVENMLRGHCTTEEQTEEIRVVLKQVTYTLNLCERPLRRTNPHPTFEKPPAPPPPPPMRSLCGACSKDLNKGDWCWLCKFLRVIPKK